MAPTDGQDRSAGPQAGAVHVNLGDRGYDVEVGTGLLGRCGALARSKCRAAARRAFIIADERVPGPTIDRAAASLAESGFTVARAGVRPGEPAKSLETVQDLLEQVAATRHERWDPVVAIGGGIVGDLAGFVAGIYRRGVPFIQCPTTLLAMVDASVGGKTGANLVVGGSLKKNMVGVFHQPLGVLADLGTLGSLPDREYRAGLAECVKHALLSAEFGDPGLWDWTLGHAGALLNREPGPLRELVLRNIAIKARVVGDDEREERDEGGRALLNLGHTFGHAIEPISALTPDGEASHAPLLHGEAVALGLVAAAAAAESMNLAPGGLRDGVSRLLSVLGLPTVVRGLPSDDVILGAMAHDKKAQAGRFRLVLPTGAGRCVVVADPPESAARAGLAAIRG